MTMKMGILTMFQDNYDNENEDLTMFQDNYDNDNEDFDHVSGDRWVIETDGLLVKNVTG